MGTKDICVVGVNIGVLVVERRSGHCEDRCVDRESEA